MTRLAIAAMMLIGTVTMIVRPADAQPVQYQFTPPPPIVALPGTEAGSPPTSWPGPHGYSHPYISHRGLHPFYGRRGRVAIVPPALHGQHSYSNRVQRCEQAGAAAGVRPGHLGAFTNRCAG